MLDNVKWLVPGQVICVQFSASVNRDQIQRMNQVCITMLDTDGKPPAVHVIIDISGVTHYEHDMTNAELLHDIFQRHALVDWVIIVDPNPNPIVRFVGMTLSSLIKFRYHVTKTQEEAINFITPRLSRASLS